MSNENGKSASAPLTFGAVSQKQGRLLSIVNSPNYHDVNDHVLELAELLEAIGVNDYPDCDSRCSGEQRVARAVEVASKAINMPLVIERWFDGERDSFGPLSRLCRVRCVGDWTLRSFIYCIYG